jgi:glycerol-3-phosphate acyltransferase PlsY
MGTENLLAVCAVVAAYLVGSFPAGFLLGRLWGVDVLKHGSGRTGGTNVLRSAGPAAALLTGALDVLKGAAAVWLAAEVTGNPAVEVLAGAGAILGHNHSLFLGFRGGAGVGTSLGALGAIYWPAALALACLLVVVILVTRYASIGSLVTMTAMPLTLAYLAWSGAQAWVYVAYGLLAWSIVVYSHRPNIHRLLSGTERRLGKRSPPGL